MGAYEWENSFGNQADAEAASGNGGVIAILKRLRTLLNGGLPAALVGGRLDVNVGNNPVLGAVTSNIGDVDVLTMPTGTSAAQVQGTVAHDGVAANNPVLGAGIAEDPDDTVPANRVSAEGDATRFVVDRDGALYMHPHPPHIWHVAQEYTTQQTDASVRAAPAASTSLYITDIYVCVNAAVNITLEEGTTTLKWKGYGDAQGWGTAKPFATPIKLTAATALTVTSSGAVTFTLVVSGFVGP